MEFRWQIWISTSASQRVESAVILLFQYRIPHRHRGQVPIILPPGLVFLIRRRQVREREGPHHLRIFFEAKDTPDAKSTPEVAGTKLLVIQWMSVSFPVESKGPLPEAIQFLITISTGVAPPEISLQV